MERNKKLLFIIIIALLLITAGFFIYLILKANEGNPLKLPEKQETKRDSSVADPKSMPNLNESINGTSEKNITPDEVAKMPNLNAPVVQTTPNGDVQTSPQKNITPNDIAKMPKLTK